MEWKHTWWELKSTILHKVFKKSNNRNGLYKSLKNIKRLSPSNMGWKHTWRELKPSLIKYTKSPLTNAVDMSLKVNDDMKGSQNRMYWKSQSLLIYIIISIRLLNIWSKG